MPHRISGRRMRGAVAVLFSMSLPFTQSCTPTNEAADPLDHLSPESFEGLVIYGDKPEGLVASINLSSGKSIHVFGDLDGEGVPRYIHRLLLLDDQQPGENLGLEFDAQGRLVKIAQGSSVLAAYSYSQDGRTVTETLSDGSVRSFEIDLSIDRQAVLDEMERQTGHELSGFFETFGAAGGTALPSKDTRTASGAPSIGWRLLSVTLSLTGLGLSTAGLMATAPASGAVVILLKVAGFHAALLSTGLSLAQAFDSTGRLSSDPSVANLEMGLAATGFLLHPLTAGAEAAEQGIIILGDGGIWGEFVLNKVDILVNVLSGSSSGGDDTPGPLRIIVLEYRNMNGITGSDPNQAMIRLSGDPVKPVIDWSGIAGRILLLDAVNTTDIEYGLQPDPASTQNNSLSPPVTYGNYNLPGFVRYNFLTLGVAPPLEEGVRYLVTVIGPIGYATLAFELRRE